MLLPVFCGLILLVLGAGGATGGGGGGAFPLFCSSPEGEGEVSAPLPCFCSIYALMKSELSAIWSSVIPICNSSSSRPFMDGSLVSKGIDLRGGLLLGGGGATWIEGAGGSSAGVICGALDAVLERWPNRLPNSERPTPDFPFTTGAGPWPRADAKGVFKVSLLALFSRSCTFLMKVLASFSSAKDKPAGQSSSSNVWKKVRSWLYWKFSKIS